MRRLFFLTVLLTLSFSAWSQKKDWKEFKDGALPKQAEIQGKEQGGQPLYLVRAKIGNSKTPGKYGKHLGKAHLAFGNKEVQSGAFQVYVGKGKWVKSSSGKIPLGAITVGYDADQKPLYAARANYRGGQHLGKMKWGFKGAHIGYGGREIEVSEYEVLVDDFKWEQTQAGQLPINAVVLGEDDQRRPAFVAQGKVDGGFCPGYSNVIEGNFPYGNRAVKLKNYSVLIGKGNWRRSSKRKIPSGAVVIGYEKNGYPLFAAKVNYDGKKLLGKMREDFKGAHILYFGKELEVQDFKVLTQD